MHLNITHCGHVFETKTPQLSRIFLIMIKTTWHLTIDMNSKLKTTECYFLQALAIELSVS